MRPYVQCAAGRRVRIAWRAFSVAFGFALCFTASATAAADDPSGAQLIEADRHFVERVRPLLAARCWSCHGPDKSEGGLRLDSREAAIEGGDSGPALVPGNPKLTLMLMAVKRTHKVLEMPPKDKLSAHDIHTLERWIQ
ncbi:MAG TPA: c-type cytochrome domain-containing protein, partial [Lacipirellulaceae bacterium]